MADPVNLNRFRKDRARAEKRAQADANAVKFGRSKAECESDKVRAEKSARDHEQHRREEGPSGAGDAD